MNNYTNMVLNNKQICEEKRILAIETIHLMEERGELISVVSLTRSTGLSRSFFYKNPDVSQCLIEARQRQQGKILTSRRDKTLNSALKEALRLTTQELNSLRQKNSQLSQELKQLQHEIQNNKDFDQISKL